VRDRLQPFAQRLALDLHYEPFPDARPSLVETAIAAARLDNNPLAQEPDLLRRAASEVVIHKPDADADDVLVYAASCSQAKHLDPAAHCPTPTRHHAPTPPRQAMKPAQRSFSGNLPWHPYPAYTVVGGGLCHARQDGAHPGHSRQTVRYRLYRGGD